MHQCRVPTRLVAPDVELASQLQRADLLAGAQGHWDGRKLIEYSFEFQERGAIGKSGHLPR
jgi:hypothetical protein